MITSFFIILAAAGSLAAADLVVSKDSLKVYNNPVSSIADGVQLVNTAATMIHLDSAVIGIDEMDTAGSGEYGLDGRFSVRWRERMNPALYLHWKLEPETGSRYHLARWSAMDAGAAALDFSGAAETLGVAFMEIGTCLGCSGIPTWYPPFFRGTLYLYFSNAQMLCIRLYSEDLRKPPASDEPCSDYRCDSMNVRKILDRNGMETYPVSSVSTVSSGRIIAVQFYFNLAAAVTMPKPLTIIPDEIGNLTALRSFSAGGNLIGSISQRIGRCRELQSLNASNNNITVLPDSIVNCHHLRTVFLDRNKLTRLPDSIGNLKALWSLSVDGNLLTSLPESVTKLDSTNCLFISGNRICTLPEPVRIWVANVRTNTNCARYEPVWPDSQECASVAAIKNRRAEKSRLPVITLHATESVLSINLGTMHGQITIVTLVDLAGKTLLHAQLLGGSTIIVPIGRLARGVYTAVLYRGSTIAGARQVLIDRQ